MTRSRLLLVLAGVVVAVSTAAPLIRLAKAPPLSVAAWRMALAALVYAALANRELLPALRALRGRDLLVLLAPGALLALHFGVWIGSLGLTSIASSVVLVATQPLFAALLSVLILRERLPRGVIPGALAAAAGCAIVAFGDAGAAPAGASAQGSALLGDVLAVAGAAAAAAYLVAGRGLRDRLPLGVYLALVHAVAAVLLVGAALLSGAALWGLAPRAYLSFALLALIPTGVGHTLLNFAVRHAPAALVTLAILGEPLGATLLGWPLLGERPPLVTAAGGALVVAGVGWALWAQRPARSGRAESN
jgi:drug/metabolite transporter (DMT)-like permease